MALNKVKNIAVTFTVCSLFLGTGCLQNIASSGFLPSHSFTSKEITSESDGIVALKEVFDSSVEKIPTLSAVGYAVVSSQPGRTDAQKRLMAIRSARMCATTAPIIPATCPLVAVLSNLLILQPE